MQGSLLIREAVSAGILRRLKVWVIIPDLKNSETATSVPITTLSV